MKIAVVHASLYKPDRKVGGIDVAVHRLASELAKHPDDEVTLFSLAAASKTNYQQCRLFSQLPGLQSSQLGQLFLFPLLLNFVDFKSFDIVHLHGNDWFYLYRPIPSVRTLHGSALNEAKTATSLKRRIIQLIVYLLEHLAVKLAACSLAIGKETQQIYHLAQRVDNGVDLQVFQPGAKTLQPSILFVGTWEGRKRGKFLFETFVESILPRVPEAKLYMVSDRCLKHPSVIDLRFPSEPDLARLFAQSWVFAYPSVYEGFGIPYIEAMASGTAIITSANEGANEVLNQGQYGWIVEDAAFGDRVVDLLNDAETRSQLATIGLERAKKFALETVAAHHREIYQTLLKQTLQGNPQNRYV